MRVAFVMLNRAFVLFACVLFFWVTQGVASTAEAAVVYLSQASPDWNQPYRYTAPNGPGPGPGFGKGDYDAWCAPTSAANLLGYWEDGRGFPVADGTPFSAGAGASPWPAPATWHDRSLGDPRAAPGLPPSPGPNDLGWWMDTNAIGYSGWANPIHRGTYIKDVHGGLIKGLKEILRQTPGLSLTQKVTTRGASFAMGTPTFTATPHHSALSAWSEVSAEIKADRPVLIHWSHWNIAPLGATLGAITEQGDEALKGGAYYGFVQGPPPQEDVWGNGEPWPAPGDQPALGLGHTTMAVGFIQAGEPEDIFSPAHPTDWVIVHDNVEGTPRNVIVPLSSVEYLSGVWTANTAVDLSVPSVPTLGGVGRLFMILIFWVPVIRKYGFHSRAVNEVGR